MSRHLKACRSEAASGGPTNNRSKKADALHIVVQDAYDSAYWLHLEVSAHARLSDVDSFLRAIWLECCGHLSQFEIGNSEYSSNGVSDTYVDLDFLGPSGTNRKHRAGMDAQIGRVLEPGDKFSYRYDFGSTTHLAMRVVDRYGGPAFGSPTRRGAKGASSPVRLLARNNPPAILCDACNEAPATQICTECGAGWLCTACAAEHECGEEMCLPVVNSPRTGVCGYTGPVGFNESDSLRFDAGEARDAIAVAEAASTVDAPPDDTVEPEPIPRSRFQMEREMWRVHRLMEGKEFTNTDEANQYLLETANQSDIEDPGTTDPKWRAQEYAYQALETADQGEAARLAREALDIDPNCADAYVALVDPAEGLDDAIELLREGVRAGERALGSKPFEEKIGHFWGRLETRPYMRARATLAEFLWSGEFREEAITHLQELLKLNPQDNQGVRYILVNRLLEMQRTGEAGTLFIQFDDDPTCMWLFPRALWLYQKEGASDRARDAFTEAMTANPHVVTELFAIAGDADEGDLYEALPEHYTIGSREEALIYLDGGLTAWTYTEGAVAWFFSMLKDAFAQSEPKTRRRRNKIGRNDPCPCGSGRKYKRCCLT